MFRRSFLICLSCFLIAGSHTNVQAKQLPEIFKKMDAWFWNNVDKICEDASDLIDKTLGSPNTLFLRIVQHTPMGSNSHPIFPSAAYSLMNSQQFDPKRKTVIFIHGFTDDPSHFSGQSFASAYKVRGNHNILALDSSKLIKMFYLRSSALVKYIGEALGGILMDLVDRGVPVENIHLVGHSLGAHIAGFAGKTYKIMRSGERLPRITGMDPAGPCFFHVDSDNRLDKDDADFVDIIHTNIGVYGINKTIGHADFYPNGGGPFQPGCSISTCSHSRVWKLYEESVVKAKSFVATECDSWKGFKNTECLNNPTAVMGVSTPPETRGVYYLRTNIMFPYGLGNLGANPSLPSNKL